MLATVMGSVRPVFNVMCVSVLVFSVLAILGMQLLSGKLARCSDTLVYMQQDCIGRSPLGVQRRWVQADINFNWIGDALVATYVISSQDHWPALMHQGMDATTAQSGPSLNASSFIAIFYVLIIFLGSFFLISVGVGVLVHTFNAAAFALDAMKPPPTKPASTQLPYVFDAPVTSTTRKTLYRLGQSRLMERFITLCILSNVVRLHLRLHLLLRLRLRLRLPLPNARLLLRRQDCRRTSRLTLGASE